MMRMGRGILGTLLVRVRTPLGILGTLLVRVRIPLGVLGTLPARTRAATGTMSPTTRTTARTNSRRPKLLRSPVAELPSTHVSQQPLGF
jgi:hypothetical protein